MRHFLAAFCIAIALLASAPAHAVNESRAFPPDNCSSGSPFMGFTGVANSNTFCNSGQDILTNALITNGTGGCTPGSELAYDNGKFICRSIVTCAANQSLNFDGHNFVCQNSNVPSCVAGTFLTFDGQTYTCKSTGVATCGNNQVLTFNGTSYFCVNKDASIPNCAANQFLTYNGSYSCASVNTPSVPNCASGQHVMGNGSTLYCADDVPAPSKGTWAGHCQQSWGGVQEIGQSVEPAFFDTTSAGYVSGYNTTNGCSCRSGYTMYYTGTCAEGNCLIPAAGGTDVMYPAGVFYSTCIKN